MNIYVGNLSFDTTDDELQELFAGFGEVDSVNIIIDKYSGRSRGFGFVEMSEKADGERAVQELNGNEFMGRAIRVNEARPREERGRGGGAVAVTVEVAVAVAVIDGKHLTHYSPSTHKKSTHHSHWLGAFFMT